MIKPSPLKVRKENPIWFGSKKNPKAIVRRGDVPIDESELRGKVVKAALV